LSLRLAENLYECLATPTSERMLEAVRQKDWMTLVSTSINPSSYSDPELFRRDYLAVELMSKFPDFDLGIDRKEVALAKFVESEDRCAETNWLFGSTTRLLKRDPMAMSVIHTASRKIEALLGPFNWDEVSTGFDHGPGATTRLRKRCSDAYYKFSGIPECTLGALPAAASLLRFYPLWWREMQPQNVDSEESILKIVPGNKVVTVPKNAKTDRVIAIEPDLNIFVQKGIGAVIRRRLRGVGVDLNDQSLNQALALIGSKENSLATIDLSSASDTLSREVVRTLLPRDWCDAIEQLRSTHGFLPDGDSICYQKVSSMGNGFTFELESLIFWAICSSVRSLLGIRDRRLAVYGDDIIVPNGAMAEVTIRILSLFGFSVNPKKTFVDGPFRESCGKHFFKGQDVTPFYVRNDIKGDADLFKFGNAVRRWSMAGSSLGAVSTLRPVYELAKACVKKPYFIPDGFGDGGFISSFDEAAPFVKTKMPWGPGGGIAYKFPYLGESTVTELPSDPALLLKSLWGLERARKRVGPDRNILDPQMLWTKYPFAFAGSRDVSSLAIPKYRKSKRRYGTVVRWPSVGPWLD